MVLVYNDYLIMGSRVSFDRSPSEMCSWSSCVSAARGNQSIVGFCPIGGPTPRGQALHAEAKRLYAEPSSSSSSSSSMSMVIVNRIEFQGLCHD